MNALQYLQEDELQTHYNAFRNWMLACYRHNIGELYSFVDEHSKSTRENLKSFLQYGLIIFRYCYEIHLINDPDIRLEGKELEFVKNFSKYVHPGNTNELYQLLNEAIFHIERNANTSILLMDLSLKISSLLLTPLPEKIS